MTQKQIIEKAMQLTIMDAIEKGHVNKDDLIKYMSSDVFEKSVDRYATVIKEEIASLV